MKRLGIGILSYFKMQRTYIKFLLFLTIINFPLYSIYRNAAKQDYAEYGSYSIGDLGGA